MKLSMFLSKRFELMNFFKFIFNFRIFAGTAVVANYLVIMTWLPASVSLLERMTCHPFQWCVQYITKFIACISNGGMYLQKVVIVAILRLPYLWILSMGAIGILSGFIVFYWPRLRLPDSPNFQLFESSHPFEIYENHFKNMFWFEKVYTVSSLIYASNWIN